VRLVGYLKRKWINLQRF